MFWLATADADGFPDYSYKGGLPGFVRVVGDSEIAFPNYHGKWDVQGNVLVNPKVGLCFIRWTDGPRRIRVQGRARDDQGSLAIAEWEGAQSRCGCRRAHLPHSPALPAPRQPAGATSAHAPGAGEEPPVPDWKLRPEYREALPERDRAALDARGFL